MDYFQLKLILGLCCVLIINTVSGSAHGLECFTCSDFKAESQSTKLNGLVKVLNSFSSQSCQMNSTDASMMHCPAPSNPDNKAKCFEFNGEITVSTLNETLVIKTTSRGCTEVKSADNDTSDGCHDQTSSTLPTYIKDYVMLTDSNDVTITGKTCFSSDNETDDMKTTSSVTTTMAATTPSASTLDCYSCTYMYLESDNVLLTKIHDVINSVSSEFCKLEKDTHVYGLEVKRCRGPSNPRVVVKCMLVEGELKFVDLGQIATVKTISRECVEVIKTDDTTTDGCHSESPIAENHVKSYFSGIELGRVNFDGEACYNSRALTNGSPQVVVNNAYCFMMLLAILLYNASSY